MNRDDEMERSKLAETSARRSHLRSVLDQREREMLAAAAVPDLNEEHGALVIDLAEQVMGEPVMSTAQLIEVLEGLIDERELTHAAVYQRIEDQASILRYRLAALAFQKGLEAGRKLS